MLTRDEMQTILSERTDVVGVCPGVWRITSPDSELWFCDDRGGDVIFPDLIAEDDIPSDPDEVVRMCQEALGIRNKHLPLGLGKRGALRPPS